jgi:hypothetical protein
MRSQSLRDFVVKSDTLHEYKCDTTVFHLDKLSLSLQIKNNDVTGLIYVVNSECSTCTGEFLDFVFHLRKFHKEIPIFAIIESGTREILQYYMEQVALNAGIDLYENTNNKYIEGSLDKHNGVIFYVFKNKTINSFLYFNIEGA